MQKRSKHEIQNYHKDIANEHTKLLFCPFPYEFPNMKYIKNCYIVNCFKGGCDYYMLN